MEKTNTRKFIDGLMFYGNATLYIRNYSKEKTSNSAIEFVVSKKNGSIRAFKTIQIFNKPFFNTIGKNKKARLLRRILASEIPRTEMRRAVAMVIASDFTDDLLVYDSRGEPNYATNYDLERIISEIMDMINIKQDDLGRFADACYGSNIYDDKLLDYICESKPGGYYNLERAKYMGRSKRRRNINKKVFSLKAFLILNNQKKERNHKK